MNIKITIEVPTRENKIDIRVNQEQRMKTTLGVLNENRKGFIPLSNIETVRIKETGRQVDIRETYEEAGIYTGAILVVEEKGGEYGE
ncbi:hypothetical protein M2454_002455 [Aequitasia blattaphilus]|uniref:Uncharacterized protein n=1 Tax=Aequitasia blattaphilus TaxID=2949332 RepID=A0ABT1EDP3_9FIRM|nr:hypothetical protein [Aequitasia blattaphilus]MCP1103067.1 hypothetical protein [Aequitasia blattaphilus]MCR8615707.1 hypothetical protein [Aequitasia blattaphilus]